MPNSGGQISNQMATAKSQIFGIKDFNHKRQISNSNPSLIKSNAKSSNPNRKSRFKSFTAWQDHKAVKLPPATSALQFTHA